VDRSSGEYVSCAGPSTARQTPRSLTLHSLRLPLPKVLLDQVDVMFEEADLVDTDARSFIFGRQTLPGRTNLLRGREMMSSARVVVAIADGEDKVGMEGTSFGATTALPRQHAQKRALRSTPPSPL
jgi:hypothetical protein